MLGPLRTLLARKYPLLISQGSERISLAPTAGSLAELLSVLMQSYFFDGLVYKPPLVYTVADPWCDIIFAAQILDQCLAFAQRILVLTEPVLTPKLGAVSNDCSNGD
jgi:hypothetical protein